MGEKETIVLFNEGKGDFIIIDDGKGSAYCRDKKIPYINALLGVKIIYFKRIVTEPEYHRAWKWLIENGRYSTKIINWADDAGEAEFAFFI